MFDSGGSQAKHHLYHNNFATLCIKFGQDGPKMVTNSAKHEAPSRKIKKTLCDGFQT